MRLFLYLVALLAGLSPAEASRAALASPVSVACAAASHVPSATKSDCAIRVAAARSFPRADFSRQADVLRLDVPVQSETSIFVTDRLRE